MKDGMRSLHVDEPVDGTNNGTEQQRRRNGDDSRSRPASRQARQGRVAEDHRQVTETAPSIDRSIDPMMMMKVTPTATISAGEAAMEMRAKLRSDRKLGLIDGEEQHQRDQHQKRCPLQQVSLVKMSAPETAPSRQIAPS